MEETFFYFFLEGRCFLAKAIAKRELQQYLLRKTFLKLTTAQQKLGLLRVNCSWLFFKSNFNLWYKNEQVTIASGCIYIERRVGG